METIGLRELNQNPSRAVARVRAGESTVVADRGRPILRMVPENSGDATRCSASSRPARRSHPPTA